MKRKKPSNLTRAQKELLTVLLFQGARNWCVQGRYIPPAKKLVSLRLAKTIKFKNAIRRDSKWIRITPSGRALANTWVIKIN